MSDFVSEGYWRQIQKQQQIIERQAAQIEQMRQAIQALENDSEECLDFDECTAVLVPIDTFHALIDAMVLSPDQALDQFAEKAGDVMRERIVETIISSANGFPMREIRDIPSVTSADVK